MKHKPTGGQTHAFTLIEMLVVISVIGILAALLFPAAAVIKRNSTLKRARAELTQLETGIENYKLKLGFYPPDNPRFPDPMNPAGDPRQGTPCVNPLYFELLGATEDSSGNYFETLDGSARILKTQVSPTFGRDAFSNLGAKKGAEEGTLAENFLKAHLKSGQWGELSPGVRVFTGPVAWPDSAPTQPTSVTGLNPWRYVSSNPTNNTKSYDLWADLVIGRKTYRISNWRKEPETF